MNSSVTSDRFPEMQGLDIRSFGEPESPGSVPPKSDALPHTLHRQVNGHGPLEPREIARLGASVCDRLIEMHERGLGHGNITPKTVLLIDGDVRLRGQMQGPIPEQTTPKHSRIERSGNASDSSADLFALSQTLYELWTGCEPLEFPSIPRSVLESKQWIPDGQRLNDVILRACDPNKSRRLPNAKTFKTELERIAEGAPPAPSRLRWVSAVIATTFLCAVGWMTWSVTPDQPVEPPAPNVAPGFLNLGLVAWYAFNGNADDASGNGNHGTGSDVSFVPDRFGKLNSAVALHDYESYIQVKDSPSLNLSSSMTISAWVKFQQAPNGILLTKGEDMQENYTVSFEPWGTMGLAARMTDGTRDLQPNETPRHRLQRSSVWQHVVLTYDLELGLSQSFVDGKVHLSGRYPPRSPQINDRALFIGNSTEKKRLLDGAIDDLRI